MISPDAALAAIRTECHPVASSRVRLEAASGRVVREDVAATGDSPPFTKAMMDGYAVRSGDSGPRRLAGESAAGADALTEVGEGEAVRIMTGAPIPAGADTVVPVELATLESVADGAGAVQGAVVDLPSFETGRNILPQGQIVRAGDPLVRAGTRVTPRVIACLAEFGVTEVAGSSAIEVAYLATGDEIVPFDAEPGPSQIRNSSGPMLRSQFESWGTSFTALPIVGDDGASLADAIQRGLSADVLVISGGVSAGRYDLIPGLLVEAGVRKVFHKVAVKPGKPLWFGVHEGQRRTLVFGLPGNPVSSMVCAEVFVRPAVAQLEGSEPTNATRMVELSAPLRQKGDRTTYWPARLSEAAGRATAEPVDWKGSADLASVAASDGWVILPPGDRRFAPGDIVRFHRPAV